MNLPSIQANPDIIIQIPGTPEKAVKGAEHQTGIKQVWSITLIPGLTDLEHDPVNNFASSPL